MWEKIKGGLGFLIGLGLMFLIALLFGLFLRGGVWLSETIYPWMVAITWITLAITILLLLPLSFIQRTRGFSSVSMLIASFVFGLMLWVSGLLYAYDIWGWVGLIIGLLFVGVGVVPIAMLATLLHGIWPAFGELVFLTVLTFGVRALSLYVANKADNAAARRVG